MDFAQAEFCCIITSVGIMLVACRLGFQKYTLLPTFFAFIVCIPKVCSSLCIPLKTRDLLCFSLLVLNLAVIPSTATAGTVQAQLIDWESPLHVSIFLIIVIILVGGVLFTVVLKNQVEKATKQLRKSEETYRALLEDLPDIVIRFDREIRHVFVSENIEQLVGIPASYFLGKAHEELDFPEHQVRYWKRHIQKVFESGEPFEGESEYEGPDGPVILNWRLIPEFDNSGEVCSVLSISKDVTKYRRAERDYQLLFHEMLDGFALHEIICDDEGKPVDYRYLAVNPAFERLTGLNAKDLIGKTILEIMPSTEKNWIEKFGRVALTGEPIQLENYAEELQKYYYVTAFQPAPNQFACTFEDITDRKRAEKELAKTKGMLEAAFAQSPSGIVIAEAENHRIVKSNAAGLSLLGGAPIQSDNGIVEYEEPDWQTFRADGSAYPRKELPLWRALIHGEVTHNEEFIIRDSNGHERWLSINAAPIRGQDESIIAGICIFQDITLRKQTEKELQQSNQQLHMALQASNMGTWDWDLVENRVFWSVETLIIFGVSEDEFGGTYEAYLDFVPPEVRKAADQGVKDFLASPPESGIIHYDHPIISGDGTSKWIEVRGTVFADKQGKLLRMTGICADITKQKKIEKEKQELEEQYRQAQKMEAVGQLTGGVAHDFNNLLQVINGATEIALSDLPNGHPAFESMTEVAHAGERAARLVKQLLLFSRRQVMRLEVLDLNDAVSNLLKLLGRVIGEHVQLKWHPGQLDGGVNADRGMIEQALVNLCVNARDAMPQGGSLTIDTNEVVIDEDYCTAHSWAEPGRYAILSVSDTGVGIDKETLEHIFEPFFTTKETGQGTGLGLATVYGIVRQHDGMIHVYSEPEQGSVFKLYWPMCEIDVSQSEKSYEDLSFSEGTETILIAEDDSMVRNVAQTLLKRAGYTVLAVENGAEAVGLFEQRQEEIDLVILDVVMPVLGGREAYDRMRTLCPDLKVLFASGYSENAIHKNFVLDDGLILIQKPFTRKSLLQAVRESLSQSPRRTS